MVQLPKKLAIALAVLSSLYILEKVYVGGAVSGWFAKGWWQKNHVERYHLEHEKLPPGTVLPDGTVAPDGTVRIPNGGEDIYIEPPVPQPSYSLPSQRRPLLRQTPPPSSSVRPSDDAHHAGPGQQREVQHVTLPQ